MFQEGLCFCVCPQLLFIFREETARGDKGRRKLMKEEVKGEEEEWEGRVNNCACGGEEDQRKVEGRGKDRERWINRKCNVCVFEGAV